MNEPNDLLYYLGAAAEQHGSSRDMYGLEGADPLREFADASNYIDSARYINETLRQQGIPANIAIESHDPTDKAEIVNLLYKLLLDSTNSLKRSQEAREQINGLNTKVGRTQQRLEAEHEALEDARKQLLSLEMRRRAEAAAGLAAEKKLKEQIKELQKTLTTVKSRDNQYKHELRKAEKTFKELQDRLAKTLEEKKQAKGGGVPTLVILNEKVEAKARAKWAVPAGKKTLSEDAVLNYEKQIATLVDENTQLRTSFETLHAQLQELISQAVPARAGKTVPEELAQALDDFSPAQIQMPMQWTGKRMTAGLQASLDLLRAHMEPACEAVGTDPDHQTNPKTLPKEQSAAVLLAKFDEQNVLLAAQDRLLQSAVLAPNAANNYATPSSLSATISTPPTTSTSPLRPSTTMSMTTPFSNSSPNTAVGQRAGVSPPLSAPVLSSNTFGSRLPDRERSEREGLGVTSTMGPSLGAERPEAKIGGPSSPPNSKNERTMARGLGGKDTLLSPYARLLREGRRLSAEESNRRDEDDDEFCKKPPSHSWAVHVETENSSDPAPGPASTVGSRPVYPFE